jgi:hypothetical protein
MPTRRRSAKRIGSLADLPDGMFWELLLGPKSCDGNRCARAGHHLPQRIGTALQDPERPVGTVYYPLKNGESRAEPHALCSEWATVEERREVYWSVRDEVFETNPGTRGWAYWAIEVGEHPSNEALWLAEHNMLSAVEEGQIVAWSDGAEASGAVNPHKAAADIIRARRKDVERGSE